MADKMYDELRTKQQLGYNVEFEHINYGVHAILMVIQSSEYSPIELQKRILNFVEWLPTKLNFEEEFEDCVAGLISERE